MAFLSPADLATEQSLSFMDAKMEAKRAGSTQEFNFHVPTKQALDSVVVDMMAQMGYTAMGPYSSETGSFFRARLLPSAPPAYTNPINSILSNLKSK